MNDSQQNRPSVSLAFLATAIAGLFGGIILFVAVPNFIKARQTSATNPCLTNLRLIDAAKNQWAVEHNATNGSIVMANQLINYLGRSTMPKCPSGGVYNIGKVGENPTCSLGTNINPPHILIN